MCKDCIPWSKLMRLWCCSRDFMDDMIRAGHLSVHEHGPRTTITKESIQDCQWRIAVAKAAMEEQQEAS